MALEDRNTEFSKVEGELIVLSITNANQELALQEQGETIRGLEQAVEAERRALEVERKQVEGEPSFDSCVVGFSLEGSHSFSDFFLVWQLQACAPRLGSRLRALGGHVTERMRRALHLGVQKALGVVRSHYEVNFEALAEGYVVPEGVEDEVAMERVDALAADAAGSLAEAFEEFLFPDAADAAAPPS
jgi:hypothetical protein